MFLTPRKNFAPPYFAVIFSYQKSDQLEGFEEMDDLAISLAKKMPGFLGYETAQGEAQSIFISYWKSEADIEKWRKNTTHQKAKQKGKIKWYDWYHSQICKVESSHFNLLNNG